MGSSQSQGRQPPPITLLLEAPEATLTYYKFFDVSNSPASELHHRRDESLAKQLKRIGPILHISEILEHMASKATSSNFTILTAQQKLSNLDGNVA